MLDQVEELKSELAARDQSLKQLQGKFERVLGSGRALLTEDAFFTSSSMGAIVG